MFHPSPTVAKETLIASCIAALLRALALTLRIRFRDAAALRERHADEPVIWVFWHNRMLVMPVITSRFFPKRNGAVLTSASRDGALIAGVMSRFGYSSVRGSSSKRGASATLALAKVIESGGDAAITPDGPRGPRYRLGPGLIFLAQKTGAPLAPVRIEYSRCIRLKSWDRFMIPLPFSRVDVTVGGLISIPKTASDAEFENERARLETLLQPDRP